MSGPDLSIFDAPLHDARCLTWTDGPETCRDADGHAAEWPEPELVEDAYPHIAEGA